MQKKLTEQGLRFLEAGQYDKAAQILSILIKSFPDNADAQHMLGIIELERGNFEAAYLLVKAALSIMPNNSVFYNTLGNIEMHRQRSAQAEAAFLNAIEYNPDKIEYKYNLAHFYLSQNLYQKAIEYYYFILHHNPTHYLSIRGITVCYLFSNEPAIALEHAEAWIKEFPAYDEAYYYLGLCYFALNDIPAALVAYDKGLNLNENNYEILTAIGACYRSLGNFSIAETYFLKSINLESNNPTAMYNLACVHLENGQLDTARKLFLNSMNLDPSYAEPICGLGNIELIKGHPDLALDYYASAHRVEPLNPKPAFLTATTLLQLEKFAKGWAALKAIVAIPAALEQMPAWNGRKLAADETLFVWVAKDNYDVGQQIMFAGLLPDLLEYAQNLIVMCDQKIINILKHSMPHINFVHTLDLYNMPEGCNTKVYHTCLNTLGERLRLSVNDFARAQTTPYLLCDQDSAARLHTKYQQLFPGKKLIGIVWRSLTASGAIDHQKSTNLQDWVQFFATAPADCQFICLQPEFYTQHFANVYVDKEINANFLNCSAEQISSLDLIISVDTDIAHLAAALGNDVYTLLPINAAWYWFSNRDTALWYTKMRLFRQNKSKQLTSLLEECIMYLK